MPGFFCQGGKIKTDSLDRCQKILLSRTEWRQTERELKDMSNSAGLREVEKEPLRGLSRCKYDPRREPSN